MQITKMHIMKVFSFEDSLLMLVRLFRLQYCVTTPNATWCKNSKTRSTLTTEHHKILKSVINGLQDREQIAATIVRKAYSAQKITIIKEKISIHL
jgi:hypothetical protein